MPTQRRTYNQYAHLGRTVVTRQIPFSTVISATHNATEYTLRWLVSPSHLMPQTVLLRRARLSLALVLALVILLALTLLARPITQADGLLRLSMILLLVIIYGIGRFISYHLCCLMLLSLCLVYPLLLFWITPADFNILTAIIILTGCVLLASWFYRLRGAWQVAGLGLLIVLLLLFITDNLPHAPDILLFYSGLTVFILGITWVNEAEQRQLTAPVTVSATTYDGQLAPSLDTRMQAEEMLKVYLVQQVVVAELGLLAVREEYFERLAEYAIVLCEQAMEADFCEISLYDASNQQLIQVLHSPSRPTSTLGDKDHILYALQQGNPVIMRDIAQETRFSPSAIFRQQGIQAGICVIIPGQLQPSGVFALYHRSPMPYKDDEIYFLQSVANVLGAFLERQQARQAEQAQRDFAAAQQEITLLLTSKLNIENVLNTILEFVAQWISGHQASTIMLLEEDGEGILFASQRGYDAIRHELKQTRIRLADWPAINHIVTTGHPLLISNTLESSLWTMPERAPWIRSYLGAPIMLEGRCLGIINVDSGQTHAFTDTDAARLLTFAGKVAIAVRNSGYATELERRVLARTLELETQRATMQAILESSAEGVMATRNQIIIFANQAMTALTGYSTTELIAQNLRLLRPDDLNPADDEQLLAQIGDTLLRGEVWRDAIQIRRKNGSVFDAGITVSLVHNWDKKALNTVIILRDISAEKALEAQTERFIADAAHELRSPITVFNTRLYLMRRRPQVLPEDLQVLDKIVTRMNRLVSDLLDMARFKQGQIGLQTQVVVLQDVLAEVVLLLAGEAEQKRLHLVFDPPTTPLQVLADPHRLHQVFTNLINNAIHYTPENGRIIITTLFDATLQAVVIRIQDTGLGIAPDELPFIFQPFFRGKNKQSGTGLGLSITREIVTLHGGSLDVTSVVGEGSCFTVRLKTAPDSET